MRQAITEQDWQKVKDIVDEHRKPLDGHEFDEGLATAAVLIQRYEQKLAVISGIISAVNKKKAKIPVGGEIVILEVSAEEAQ